MQNAASFLEELSEIGGVERFHIVTFNDGPLAQLVERLNFPHLFLKRTPTSRFLFDIQCRRYYRRGEVCFTFFGPPWYGSRGYLVNIGGVAYSNLYYPEVPFWRFLPIHSRMTKHFVDCGRMFGCSWLDYWIFETEAMAERATTLAGYPAARVGVVRMTPSKLVSPDRVDFGKREAFRRRIGAGLSLLFLAGPNPNKRIANIAPAVAVLRNRSVLKERLTIVTTLEPTSAYCEHVAREFRRHNVFESWINLGPIPPDDVASLMDACSIVCLFSALESFSNNCVEAWVMRKPLIITDMDWSRDSCGPAAVYVDPHNAEQVASAITKIGADERYRNAVLGEYSKQLAVYPSRRAKCDAYLEHIRRAQSLGLISRAERRSICRFRCRKACIG